MRKDHRRRDADGRYFKTNWPIQLTRHPFERPLPRASLYAYFGEKRATTAEVIMRERSVSAIVGIMSQHQVLVLLFLTNFLSLYGLESGVVGKVLRTGTL